MDTASKYAGEAVWIIVTIVILVLAARLIDQHLKKYDESRSRDGAEKPRMARPEPNWGAMAGALLFLAGTTPYFIFSMPSIYIAFIGIAMLAAYLSPRLYGKTDWGAWVFSGALILACGLPFVLKNRKAYLIMMVGGLSLALFSLFFKARRVRRNWVRIPARVLEREIIKEEDSEGKTWAFRLLCEFDLNGRTYRVTPGFWRTFATRWGINRFLDNRISDGGLCELFVNPESPDQTELVGRDVKDFLLHR